MLFLVSITGALAGNERVILDDWIRYDSEFIEDNVTYVIRGAEVNDPDEEKGKILIKRGAQRYIVEFGECETAATYEYCFINRSFNEEEVDIDAQGQLQPALRILLKEFDLEVDLEATKSVAKTSFRVNEEAEVELVVENKGDFVITDIVVIDKVPDNFKVLKNDHPFSDNTLIRTFNLFPGNSWSTKYTIKALEARNASINTTISYTAQEEQFNEVFGERELTFSDSYVFSSPSLKEEYIRLDKDIFSFSVENKEAVDIYVQSVEVRVSPQISTSEKFILKKQSPTRFTLAQEEVPPGIKKDFEIGLEFLEVGSFEIEYEVEVAVRNEVFTHNQTFIVDVALDELKCTIDIPNLVNASSIVKANIILENGEGETFYEIEGQYNLGNEQGEYLIKNIFEERSIIVKRAEFIVPFSLNTTNYTLTHHARYRTVDNKYFTCEFEKNITANPAIQLIELEAGFQDEQIKRNETTNIILRLTNVLTDAIIEPINVYISSVHGSAEPISLDGLSTSESIEIPFEVYEYLRAENASLTINLNIPTLNNYADSVLISVPVSNPYTGNLTIWELEEQERDELQEELLNKERERQNRGFFEKIIDYLKDFFR